MLGVINPAGHLGVCALMLTSPMDNQHIIKAISGLGERAGQATKEDARKRFTMSDSENAYQDGLSSVFHSEALMCGFHLVQAIRKYWFSHASLPETEKSAL